MLVGALPRTYLQFSQEGPQRNEFIPNEMNSSQTFYVRMAAITDEACIKVRDKQMEAFHRQLRWDSWYRTWYLDHSILVSPPRRLRAVMAGHQGGSDHENSHLRKLGWAGEAMVTEKGTMVMASLRPRPRSLATYA